MRTNWRVSCEDDCPKARRQRGVEPFKFTDQLMCLSGGPVRHDALHEAGTRNDSPSETYLGPAAVVDMPDVVDLLLDVGEMLIEVRERVEIFSERLLDVRDGGIQGDVRAPLTML